MAMPLAEKRRRQAASMRRLRAERAEPHHREKHGCSSIEYLALRNMCHDMMAAGVSRWKTPISAYIAHRRNARVRGVPFKLTLWQWWMIWLRSGKFDKRGVCMGQYVMARHGDLGAYEVGNVSIVTAAENQREYHQVTRPRRMQEVANAKQLSAERFR